MRARILLAVLVTLGVAVGLAGGQASAATPPPTLLVQVIGAGKVTGTGISCGLGALTCAATYSDGSPVTLTPAAGAAGWTFDHWEDGCAGSPCAPSPSNPPTIVTAVYVHAPGSLLYPTFSVALSSDDGGVANGSTGYPIDCGDTDNDPATADATACDLSVPQGSTLAVQETPDTGFFFNGWGGSCSGTRTTCAAYLSADRPVSAEFLSSSTNQLEVTVDGSGSVSGGGINCSAGSTCDKQEPPTASVTLTATPSSGYAFTGWSGGDCSGTQTTCTVEMNTDRKVTASFDPLVPVGITVNGAGTVTGANVTCGPGPATCNGSAAPNSKPQLQATPSVAGGTVTWTGCASAVGLTCNLNVGSSPVNVTATFSGGSTGGGSFVALAVTVTGDGYVTGSSGSAQIYCTAAGGSGCSASVQQGATVVLHANPASGSFADFTTGWGNACAGTSLSCTVTMNGAKSVTADFAGDDTTQDLTVSVVGTGTVTGAGLNNCRTTGSSGCKSPQAANATVNITAIPGSGETFAGWSGDCTGTDPTCSVTMDSDQTVTATFRSTAPSSETLSITVAGHGTVTGGTTPCVDKTAKPATCTSSEKAGATVELKAAAAKGYVFAGWSGACTGTKPTCKLVLNAPTAVTATFKVAPISRSARKPTVVKTATGYRITISFRAGESGRLTVTTKPKTATVKTAIKAGARSVRVTVKKKGRYLVTLSLRSKSGTHAIRYTVKV